ncbi:MAG: GFA family protein [Leptolyngbyaceae cyanobacterium bins.349]|nr:GFA family protein [Leptolyngbyaceae cyanobacterium bins.349]
MSLQTYEGGCHCGAVRFRVMADPIVEQVEDCNCSICRKKGFLHLIVPPERFTLLAGDAALATYTFNTGVAKHLFCQHCGIHAFYHPRSHPHMIDVNLRCFDDDVRSQFRIVPFDGVNWEDNVSQIPPKK